MTCIFFGTQGVDHLMMMYLPEIIVELLGTLGGREEDGTDGENLGNDYDFTRCRTITLLFFSSHDY